MQPPGFNINELVQEAKWRWLKPAEVLFILQNHENHQLTEAAPQKPPSGSLFLFNKRVLRFFRRDGYDWRKKKDGRTVGEAHERLKVGNVEALNCYYAHGEHNSSFQRRSYWMLDSPYDHIVLVHYRDINEGRSSAGSVSHLPTSSQEPSLYTSNPGSSSAISGTYRSSFSPGSVEVNSEMALQNNVVDHLDRDDRSGECSNPNELEVSQALRRIEEQLSLNDNEAAELSTYYEDSRQSYELQALCSETVSNHENVEGSEYGDANQYFAEDSGTLDDLGGNLFLQRSGDNRKQSFQQFPPEYTIERKDSPFWKEMLELCSGENWIKDKNFNTSDRSEKAVSSEMVKIPQYQAEEAETAELLDPTGDYTKNRTVCVPSSDDDLSMQLSAARQFLLGPDNLESPTSTSLVEEAQSKESSAYSTRETDPYNYNMRYDQENQPGVILGGESSLTLAEKQKFSIREISPGWGYANEDTKVIIIGSFLCDPSECAWHCMFGTIEVPAQIIQEGVLCCWAPKQISGKVTLCITSGNRESCSEIREFEYVVAPNNFTHSDLRKRDDSKSTEELLLLVRFAQMLLSETVVPNGNRVSSSTDVNKETEIDEDQWGFVIEAILFGSVTPSNTIDWLLEKLLKDKLQQWLSSKNQEGDTPNCSLSKKEQGIIHLLSGLGFEWAVNPILDSGISINFRDVNGWTALHWAARFGREKMIAALIAAGASAEAVTDPTSQDPAGKTAATIASASGHIGLAGYLSEMALTSHLSSLTLEESEISKGTAALVADKTIESISNGQLDLTEDQGSLRDTLAAVRNAAQAAARIQSAFRARSFRRRQQKEAATASYDEYGFTSEDIQGLSVASKLTFRGRDHKLDRAALSIQKKYRGWKGRKDFLALRQKVVRIQAHVRGHQVRKKYKLIMWAVGVFDKVVLRWRRKGAGLRGFRPEPESIDESEDDEDILKVFRKQKVDEAIEIALSQVTSMAESPEARQQYKRMLDSYKQAKAVLSEKTSEQGSTSQGISDMEKDIDDFFQFH